MLQNGRFKEVMGLATKSDAAIGKIVAHGLERMQSPARREDIDNAMEEGMMEIVPRLEKRTHYIATLANVITLVGLLGTIIGLIKGFTAVAAVNPAEKAELLSASISIAMNNTAFALSVAIPFLLIHAFLQARTSEIVDGLEAAKISFLNLVQRLNLRGDLHVSPYDQLEVRVGGMTLDAAIDRLVHHSVILEFSGKALISYRFMSATRRSISAFFSILL